MGCRGFWECLLKLLNLLVMLVGLAMVGYGIYLFVVYEQSSSSSSDSPTGAPLVGDEVLQLGRPLLMSISLNSSIWDDLANVWFLCVFVGVGVVLFVISCCGCVGAATRNGCCLSCYAVFVVLLILVELGCAAFIYFDSSWEDDIPTDQTGDFDKIYDFLKEHWSIIKWVALGIVVLEALLFLLALLVRAANRPTEYDSDDEFINARQSVRKPLINRPPPPGTSVPVAGALDQRPSRNDAWSARMREKYGLDTSEFTYNPSEAGRQAAAAAQPAEEKGRCTIM
ncbi:hypothetical protein Nepgr_028591 [Nepenthes gracilis]|uniref:Tobamovirus multiplication protein 2A n=1 Tax=Nepenthes gracilis TaxID=150966 RepID=A0AAD3TB12_NEPGR|nr:hypothetical protein Nepgr_028591 [Nepenthes gracilis]